MKIGDYEIPEDLLYTKEHEWVRETGGRIVVGMTDYAAKMLHDIVYVALPSVGDKLTLMGTLGSVESIKAVSDIYSPLSGNVARVNDELSTRPELMNQSPYGEGWLIEIESSDAEREKASLLKPEQYVALIEEANRKQE